MEKFSLTLSPEQEAAARSVQQYLNLPPHLPLRDYDQSTTGNSLRRMLEQHGPTHTVWAEAAALLRRKSVHVQDYKVDHSNRIALTMASAFFPTRELAQEMEIELSTALKIIQEVSAAIYYSQREIEHITPDELTIDAREQLLTFSAVSRVQAETEEVMRDWDVTDALVFCPPFAWLAEAQLQGLEKHTVTAGYNRLKTALLQHHKQAPLEP